MKIPDFVVNNDGKSFIVTHETKVHKKFTSPLPFDYAYQVAKKAYDWLVSMGEDLSDIGELEEGTRKAFEQYWELRERAAECQLKTHRQCETDLDPRLNQFYQTKERVEIVYSELFRERGYIGKSLGWCPTYILLKQKNSFSGGGVGKGFISVRGLGIYKD